MKKQPQRTCIGCGSKKDKKDLIRIVHNKEGEIAMDRTSKMPGRGAYLCDKIECLEKAIKTKKLERTFECKIKDEIYEDLRGVMSANRE